VLHKRASNSADIFQSKGGCMNVDRSQVLKLASVLTEILGAANDSQPEDKSTHRYVTISLASQKTGFTESAIRQKIHTGTWIEGREWKHAPCGRIMIDMEGYSKWVEKAAA
jgi:hypothetical protein